MSPARVSQSSSGVSPLPANRLQPNLARATDLVLDLLALPGVSGGEQQVADYIKQRLLQAGGNSRSLESDQAHRRTRLNGHRGNLVFRFRGTSRAPRRMLVAHMDTVPICLNAQPIIKGNRVFSKDL